MPIYEYLCPNCGNKVEALNKAEVKCKCGAMMKKIISAPADRIYTKV